MRQLLHDLLGILVLGGLAFALAFLMLLGASKGQAW